MMNYSKKINGKKVMVSGGEYNEDGNYFKEVSVDYMNVGTITNWNCNDKAYGTQTHMGYLFQGVGLRKKSCYLEPFTIDGKRFESLESLANWLAGCRIVQVDDAEYAIRELE